MNKELCALRPSRFLCRQTEFLRTAIIAGFRLSGFRVGFSGRGFMIMIKFDRDRYRDRPGPRVQMTEMSVSGMLA